MCAASLSDSEMGQNRSPEFHLQAGATRPLAGLLPPKVTMCSKVRPRRMPLTDQPVASRPGASQRKVSRYSFPVCPTPSSPFELDLLRDLFQQKNAHCPLSAGQRKVALAPHRDNESILYSLFQRTEKPTIVEIRARSISDEPTL